MMLVDRRTGTIEHRQFAEFPEFGKDYLLVLNDTRVARARFFSNDGRIEILRLKALEPLLWQCFVKPGKKMRLGATVEIGEATGVVEGIEEGDGSRIIRFDRAIDENVHGHLALPHYMKRDDDSLDSERYQTVFANADKEKSIAAPTAGLHFTPAILSNLNHEFVTLHVGVGTFQPVKAERLEDHLMHVENYEISSNAAARINSAPRVLAVGTTASRVLEHNFLEYGQLVPGEGETGIFIRPGFQFRRVNALLTNFHLPKSTLFMLVSAMAGTELMREAYQKAVESQYRFFSYGDSMLII